MYLSCCDSPQVKVLNRRLTTSSRRWATATSLTLWPGSHLSTRPSWATTLWSLRCLILWLLFLLCWLLFCLLGGFCTKLSSLKVETTLTNLNTTASASSLTNVCDFLFQQHSLKNAAICTTHLPIVQFFYNQHIKWFILLGQLITFESKGLDNQITWLFWSCLNGFYVNHFPWS
jgi:hypothetical protein